MKDQSPIGMFLLNSAGKQLSLKKKVSQEQRSWRNPTSSSFYMQCNLQEVSGYWKRERPASKWKTIKGYRGCTKKAFESDWKGTEQSLDWIIEEAKVNFSNRSARRAIKINRIKCKTASRKQILTEQHKEERLACRMERRYMVL